MVCHAGLDPASSGSKILSGAGVANQKLNHDLSLTFTPAAYRISTFYVKTRIYIFLQKYFITFLLYNKMNISIKEVKTMHESTGGAGPKETTVAPPIRLTTGYS